MRKTITLRKGIGEQIKKIAKEQGVSQTVIINEALKLLIDTIKKETDNHEK